MRHLLDPSNSHPTLVLEDARCCMEAVAAIFVQERVSVLTERECAGFSIILRAVSDVMGDTQELLYSLRHSSETPTPAAPAQPAPRGTEYPRVDPPPAEVEEEPEARPARARRRA